MKKKILKEWISHLRSNNYTQVKGFLRKKDSYCPMGILCLMYDSKLWKPFPYADDVYSFNGQTKYLPSSVAEWAGMSKEEAGMVSAYMIYYNDHGFSFNEIADLLEQKYGINNANR